MNKNINRLPKEYSAILTATQQLEFNQLSERHVGALVATLCASKPNGAFLELGTGTGLGTAWILDGMCGNSSLITVDNDPHLVQIAKNHLDHDTRVEFVVANGEDVITRLQPSTIDLIFADSWPGKYHHLEETLALLKPGGFYVVDDMIPQPNWPDGHDQVAQELIASLLTNPHLKCIQLDWSTGVMVCVKTSS